MRIMNSIELDKQKGSVHTSEQKQGHSKQHWPQRKSHYIFPVTPLAPAGQHQGVPAANPQLAGRRRVWYQSGRRTFKLWSHGLEENI